MRVGAGQGRLDAPAPTRRRYAARLPIAQRREQLLDAALALIADDGYAAASMEAIARAAGVTKPVVYDAFASRAELLRTLLQREEGRVLAQLADAIPLLPLEADPDAVLLNGARAFLEAVVANPGEWRLILLPVEGTPTEVRDHVERGRERIHGQLRALLEWGIEQRGGPFGLDLDLAAHGIIALAEQLARLLLTQPASYTPERAANFVAGLLRLVPNSDSPDLTG